MVKNIVKKVIAVLVLIFGVLVIPFTSGMISSNIFNKLWYNDED